jgi:hypothetical protein
MNNKPRDHHFIPVFYLKQWASSSTKKIFEYSQPHGKFVPKPVGPDSTGFQRDLYAFPELPPDVAQHIEDVFLRDADDKASRAHQRILAWDKSPWEPEMMKAWVRCIMHMHLRHPDVIGEMRVAAAAIWQASGGESQRIYEQDIRKPDDPATFQQYLERIDPVISAKVRMNMIIRAIDNEAIGQSILKMTWHVIDTNRSPKTLITSDRPVLIYNLIRPDGWIALPVSPTKLFFAVNSQATLQTLLKGSTLSLVERSNEQVVARARRYVWARDPWQEWYIRTNMGKRKEPTPLFPRLANFSDEQ